MTFQTGLPSLTTGLIHFLAILLCCCCHLLAASDNLPFLAGNLRTYQASACDNETLHLQCHPRTVISIVVAQYGQPTHQPYLCKSFFNQPQADLEAHSAVGQTQNGNLTTGRPQCHEADLLRYNFLKTVERTCRKQYVCDVSITPENLDLPRDPCAEHVKYAEVAYKCRPNLFANKILCEGQTFEFSCKLEERIVVLSAFFGAKAQAIDECPESAKAGVDRAPVACEVSYANEFVIGECNGRRNCTVKADINTFGKPPACLNRAPRPRLHLKVVWTCISKKMLLLPVDTRTTTTTTTTTTTMAPTTSKSTQATTQRSGSGFIQGNKLVDTEGVAQLSTEKPSKVSSHSRIVEVNASKDDFELNTHPLMDSVNAGVQRRMNVDRVDPSQHVNCTKLPSSMQVIGFVSDWISAVAYIKRNKERFILYMLVSLFGSLVCFLVVLSAKLYTQKRTAKRKAREEQAAVTPFEIMNFDDDLDDLDNFPGSSGGVLDTGTYIGPSHRQYSYVPPSVSNLVPDGAIEPRPLLYSTLRKKQTPKGPSLYTDADPWASVGSRTSTGGRGVPIPPPHVHQQQTTQPPTLIDYNSPLSTLPKSILCRGPSASTSATMGKPSTAEVSTSTNGSFSGFATMRQQPTTATIRFEDTLGGQNGQPFDQQEQFQQQTDPKSMSKSLNNFFM